MSPFNMMMASSFFQTRNLSEWLDDEGPASRAHAQPGEPASRPAPEGLRTERDLVTAK